MPVDLIAAENAVASLLGALGLDLGDEHLTGTPHRVAKMYAELLTGCDPFTITTFAHHPDPSSGPIIVRDITFTSFCAHHLLPFTGVVHIGYVPGDRIVGLSKLARIVHHCARRPQVQERLTSQIADSIMDGFGPVGCGVFITARHACMELRGARAEGSLTLTSTFRGTCTDLVERDRLTRAVDGTERRVL